MQTIHAVLSAVLVALLALKEVTAGPFPFPPNVILDLFFTDDCSGPALDSEIFGVPAICLDTFFPFDPETVLINGRVVPNITSYLLSCPAQTVKFGVNGDLTCAGATTQFSRLCLSEGLGGASVGVRCIPDICKPEAGMVKAQCDNRVAQCAQWGFGMKWTDKGCLRRGGRPWRDGGCQCKGYCGYKCARSCRRDPECFWNANTRTCFSKETQMPGVPISQCPFSCGCAPRDDQKKELLSNSKMYVAFSKLKEGK